MLVGVALVRGLELDDLLGLGDARALLVEIGLDIAPASLERG